MAGHTAHKYNHKVDTDRAIKSLETVSRANGERMTSIRRDVVAVLSRQKKPLSSYKILAEINKGRIPQLSYTTLWRTLEFLLKMGIVIKYDSQNVYRLCLGHDHNHSHLLMICNQCGDTREVEDCSAEQKLQTIAKKHGHTLTHNVVELRGTCTKCLNLE